MSVGLSSKQQKHTSKNTGSRISRMLFKKEVWLFYFLNNSFITEHLLYEWFVCKSVGQSTKGRNLNKRNVNFSIIISDRGLIFFVLIHLINAHLFYEWYNRQSVGQATKGRNLDIFTILFFVKIHLINEFVWSLGYEKT